jgi:RNA processing factor Prp31
MKFSELTTKSMHDCIKLMGEKACVLVAVEEMAELSKELLKNVNRGKDNYGELFEEVADVSLMVEYLKVIYHISDKEIHDYQDDKTREKWLPRIEKMKAERNGR